MTLSMERGESSARVPGPSQPSIFLSHSGKQKGFVTHLFNALRNVHHKPFFDMDRGSLPPGLDYPPHIFRACHGCQLGVVVLSHDYMESLWPMLELQHLLLYNHDRQVYIYPLFYELQTADLFKEENLERWKQHWSKKDAEWQTRMQELQEIMGGEVQINLDPTSWPRMLKMLPCRSGKVRLQYQSDYEYVHAIVSDILSVLPPPVPYSLDKEIKGHERMIKEVTRLFDQQAGSNIRVGAHSVVSVVGMHGIGGSGKSTLCKAMAIHYSKEFSGKSWWLELPSNANEDAVLVNQIKHILQTYEPDALKHVLTLDQTRRWRQHTYLKCRLVIVASLCVLVGMCRLAD